MFTSWAQLRDLRPLTKRCQRNLAMARCLRSLLLHVGFAVVHVEHKQQKDNEENEENAEQGKHVQKEVLVECAARSPGQMQK